MGLETGHPPRRVQVSGAAHNATLVELHPITGRTNQLRIHCAFYGHPIVGDELYEAVVSGRWSVVSEEPQIRNEPTTSGEATDRRPLTTDHRGLSLHAYRLAFHHPATGEWMEFTSSPPPDFISRLDVFRSER